MLRLASRRANVSVSCRAGLVPAGCPQITSCGVVNRNAQVQTRHAPSIVHDALPPPRPNRSPSVT
jgi:hypothetical protein